MWAWRPVRVTVMVTGGSSATARAAAAGLIGAHGLGVVQMQERGVHDTSVPPRRGRAHGAAPRLDGGDPSGAGTGARTMAQERRRATGRQASVALGEGLGRRRRGAADGSPGGGGERELRARQRADDRAHVRVAAGAGDGGGHGVSSSVAAGA
jgi:hypothetical protein